MNMNESKENNENKWHIFNHGSFSVFSAFFCFSTNSVFVFLLTLL